MARLPVKSAVALVVALLLGLPLVATLQPAYYERFPGLGARMANWRTSTHARIPCSGCHVDPGVGGLLGFWARSVPAFYSQLLLRGDRQSVLSVPGRDACRKCHTSYRHVSPSGDLRIPHKAHVEVIGLDCAVCHKDLVHSRNAEGFDRPEMSTCLTQCHDGHKATDRCVDCHTRKQVPEGHKRPDWLRVHSTMTDEVDCGECHGWAPDYCKTCHADRPRSHRGNWKQTHQARAKAHGTKGCLFCHDGPTFCTRCHDDVPSVTPAPGGSRVGSRTSDE